MGETKKMAVLGSIRIKVCILLLILLNSYAAFLDADAEVLDNGDVNVTFVVYDYKIIQGTETVDIPVEAGCETTEEYQTSYVSGNITPLEGCTVKVFKGTESLGEATSDYNGTGCIIINGTHFNPGEWTLLKVRSESDDGRCDATTDFYFYYPFPDRSPIERMSGLVAKISEENKSTCFVFTILLGILLASMYFFGLNPFSILDIVTPKFKKFKAVRKKLVGKYSPKGSAIPRRVNSFLAALATASKVKKTFLKKFGSEVIHGRTLREWMRGWGGRVGINFLPADAQVAAMMMLFSGRIEMLRRMLARVRRNKRFVMTNEERQFFNRGMQFLEELENELREGATWEEAITKLMAKYGLDMHFKDFVRHGVPYIASLREVENYRQSVIAEYESKRPHPLGKVPLVGKAIAAMWVKPRNRLRKDIRFVSEWANAYKSKSLLARVLAKPARIAHKLSERILWGRRVPKLTISQYFDPEDMMKVTFKQYLRKSRELTIGYLLSLAMMRAKDKKEMERIKEHYLQVLRASLSPEEFYNTLSRIVSFTDEDKRKIKEVLTRHNSIVWILESDASTEIKAKRLEVYLSSLLADARSIDPADPMIMFPFYHDFSVTDNLEKMMLNIERLKYAWAFHLYAQYLSQGRLLSFDTVLKEVEGKLKKMIEGDIKVSKTIWGRKFTRIDKQKKEYQKAFSEFMSALETADAVLNAEVKTRAKKEDKSAGFEGIKTLLGITDEDLYMMFKDRTINNPEFRRRLKDKISLLRSMYKDERSKKVLDKVLSSYYHLVTSCKDLSDAESKLRPIDKIIGLEDYIRNQIILSTGKKGELGRAYTGAVDQYRETITNLKDILSIIKNKDPAFYKEISKEIKSLRKGTVVLTEDVQELYDLVNKVDIKLSAILPTVKDSNVSKKLNEMLTNLKNSMDKTNDKWERYLSVQLGMIAVYREAVVNRVFSTFEEKLKGSLKKDWDKYLDIKINLIENGRIVKKVALKEAINNFGNYDRTNQIIIMEKLNTVVQRLSEKRNKLYHTPPLDEVYQSSVLSEKMVELDKKFAESLGMRMCAILRDYTDEFDIRHLENRMREYHLLVEEYKKRFGDDWQEHIKTGPTYDDLAKGIWVFRTDTKFMPYVRGLPLSMNDTVLGGVVAYNIRGKQHFIIDVNNPLQVWNTVSEQLRKMGVHAEVREPTAYDNKKVPRLLIPGKEFTPSLLEHQEFASRERLEKVDLKTVRWYSYSYDEKTNVIQFVFYVPQEKDGKEVVTQQVLTYNLKTNRITTRTGRVINKDEFLDFISDYAQDPEKYKKEGTTLYVDIGKDVYVPVVRKTTVVVGHPEIDGMSMFDIVRTFYTNNNAPQMMDAWGYFDIVDIDRIDPKYRNLTEGDRLFQSVLGPAVFGPAAVAWESFKELTTLGGTFNWPEKFEDKVAKTIGYPLKRWFGPIQYEHSRTERALMTLFVGMKMELENPSDISEFSALYAAKKTKGFEQIMRAYTVDVLTTGLEHSPTLERIRKNIENKRAEISQLYQTRDEELYRLQEEYNQRIEKIQSSDLSPYDKEKRIKDLQIEYETERAAIERMYNGLIINANDQLDHYIEKAGKEIGGLMDSRLTLQAMENASQEVWLQTYEKLMDNKRVLKKVLSDEYADLYKALDEVQKNYEEAVGKHADMMFVDWASSMSPFFTLKLDPNNEQRLFLHPFGVHSAPEPKSVLSSDESIYGPILQIVYPIVYGAGMYKREMIALAKRGSWSPQNCSMYDPELLGAFYKWEAFTGTANFTMNLMGTFARFVYEKTGWDKAAKVYERSDVYVLNEQGVSGREFYMGTRKFLPEQWVLFENLQAIDKDRMTYTDWAGRKHWVPMAARVFSVIHPTYLAQNPEIYNDIYRDVYAKFNHQGRLGSALYPALSMNKDEYLRYINDQWEDSQQIYWINPMAMTAQYPFASLLGFAFGPVGALSGFALGGVLNIRAAAKAEKGKPLPRIFNSMRDFITGKTGYMPYDLGYKKPMVVTSYKVCPKGHLVPVAPGSEVKKCWCGEELK